MTKFVILAALGALLCVPLIGAGPNYSFSTFDVTGAATTEVFGINDSGQFTGFWSAGGATGSVRNGFLASIGGSTATINDSNGFANTSPTGINDAGIVVGCSGTCSGLTAQANTSFSVVGTTWTNFNPTGQPGTFKSSAAAGMNFSGLIVGSYISTVNGINGSHAYVDNGGTFTTINDPGNVNGTFATGVNNSGSIVGFYSCASGGGCGTAGIVHGFLTSTSTPTTFTDIFFPGQQQTAAQGIDSVGNIVGFYKDLSGTNHGFILTGGTYYTIDDPAAGGFGTQILGISPKGNWIVGTYMDSNGNNHGFVATSTATTETPDDFNGDGVPDIVWQDDATRQVAVWYMGGSGGAVLQGSNWISSTGLPGWHVAAIADFDKNGVPDVVWQNDTTRQVAVWYMGGSGGVVQQGAAWISSAGVPGWSVVATADFNGDGVPDVVWQNDTTKQVAVWYMGGSGGAVLQGSNWISSAGVPGWSVAMAADFNRDGVPDVVWQDDTTRQVAVWYMGGSGGVVQQGAAFISSAGVPGWSVEN